ncbi:MAG: AMP-binding protein, partial [bacterium]|nr:AMP-binding protein [bacterium]
LKERAQKVARAIQKKGAGLETIVAIMAEPSPNLAAGILGILEAGAAYLPIDNSIPANRAQYMLEDSKATIILTNKKGVATYKKTNKLKEENEISKGIENLDLDRICEDKKEITQQAETRETTQPTEPANLAYIIYTSGTTGKPRGVMVEHRNVAGLMLGSNHLFGFDNDDVWTLYHSYSFDFSVWEM